MHNSQKPLEVSSHVKNAKSWAHGYVKSMMRSLPKTIQPRQQAPSQKLQSANLPRRPTEVDDVYYSCTSHSVRADLKKSAVTDSRKTAKLKNQSAGLVGKAHKQQPLSSPSLLRSQAAETLYLTARDEDEDLICDEELIISEEAEHSDTQMFAAKISKMEYETSCKKPDLTFIRQTQEDSPNELIMSRKFLTYGPTTASSKVGYYTRFPYKTSDFYAFDKAKLKSNEDDSDD
jgi:hypothetical protein